MPHVRVALALILGLGALGSTSGCTIVRVENDPAPSTIRATGLVRGHAAFGFSDEYRFFNARVLGGASQGALAEVVLWKLLRVEAGLAGVSLGVGPLHFGIGTLFYRPKAPTFPPRETPEEPVEPPPSDEDWSPEDNPLDPAP